MKNYLKSSINLYPKAESAISLNISRKSLNFPLKLVNISSTNSGSYSEKDTPRFYSSQIDNQVTKRVPRESEITMYIKGFLSRGDCPQDFSDWFHCHKLICENKKNSNDCWYDDRVGFCWKSGTTPSALPYITTAMAIARATQLLRVNPIILPLALISDLAIYSSSLFIQYKTVQDSINNENCKYLAEELGYLSKKYEYVRVVSHSLGCQLISKALQLLDLKSRPNEIHMCAPACTEDEIGDNLNDFAKEKIFIYYSNQDYVLNSLFKFYHDKSAIGLVGLEKGYTKVKAINVESKFNWKVHSEYSRLFHKIVE